MLTGRHDIVGDLARLRKDFVGAETHADDRLTQLELLASAAVRLGVLHNIVRMASGIPQEHIDAVLESHPTGVGRTVSRYERCPSGAICQRD